MPTRKRRRVTAEDLYGFELIGDTHLSPDGHHIVYSVQRVDKKTEKKYSNLWIVPTDKGRARQFTYGDHSDDHARWSPDGASIAFISNRADRMQPQIYIISFTGGEARPLTQLKGDIGGFAWSPNGKQFVCTFRKKDKEAVERESDERKKKLGIVSRHITRAFFKFDGEGFLPEERWHIWTINTRSGRAQQLTASKDYDEFEPAWSPDGRSIAFVSNRSSDPDLDVDAVDLFVINASSGRVRKIDTSVGFKEMPTYSPDGKWIAYFGTEGRGDWWKNTLLWIVPANGKGKTRSLTTQFDIHVSSATINDMGAAAMMPPTWSNDGAKIYFQATEQGSTTLKSISIDGEKLESLLDEKGVVGSFRFDQEQKGLTYFFGEMKQPGQLCVHDIQSRSSRQLTNLNRRLLRSLDLGRIEEVWYKGAAGNNLQGWILKPPGFRKSRKYPAILEIHGGPYAQYGEFFMHEFYFLAANGYVVFFSNPRGGCGYGEEHAKAIWNAWGTADYDDVMVWTDVVANLPYVDEKRLGVTGGSYGGFLTNWIIGHTARFKAAVTQRSVSNMISEWGSSDVNWTFQYAIGDDKPPWENHDHYWEQSPMKHIGNATTPTMIIHSEQDFRCDIEQGEQVFVALKRLGVDTEMIRFPDEPHGLSRTGRTDRRVVRLNHMLRWFDKYLKKS